MTPFVRLAVLGVMAAPWALQAHHSFAMFDLDRTTSVSGTIKEMQWVNPHAWLQVNVPDASGKVVEWSFESGNPSGLYKLGWRQSALKSGDRITVRFHPLRDGRPGGSLAGVTLADGTQLPAERGQQPAAPEAKP